MSLSNEQTIALLVKILACAPVPFDNLYKATVGDLVIEASDPYDRRRVPPLNKIGYLSGETPTHYSLCTLTMPSKTVRYSKKTKPMFKVLVPRKLASLLDL